MSQGNGQRPFSVHRSVSQLREGLATIAWAVDLMPASWYQRPLKTGAWSAATNLAHLIVYEERVSVPVLHSLADGGNGTDAVSSDGEGWLVRESEALGQTPLTTLLERFQAIRMRQIEIVSTFTDERLSEPRCAVTTPMYPDIGLHPAGLVVMKSVQHTWEHGNEILKVARIGYSYP